MSAPQGTRPGKKLPKRTGKLAHKERRARCWERGQARKAFRREAQNRREATNRSLRAAGVLTPWQIARQKRIAHRHPELAVM